MAPNSTVHLIRHAEGYHQLPRDHPNVQIRDALLTEAGLQQGKDFCDEFPYHDKTELLCASPLRRTIQTAQLAFKPEIERGMQILAVPEAQECLDDPSDTGSPASDLKSSGWPDGLIDYPLLSENWYVKEGINAPNDLAWRARAQKLRRLLRERPEQNIVLVTHGMFGHYITEHIDPEGHQTGESAFPS
ncbi:hypothetical protein PMZ80_005274 [Knufia obscura]|uniref:Phosphoglycerate mutase-like protein n=2 Tax=Knufia TaxID=430999 RepID=A0AAN8FG71_9EURO|nr:hypothetical protein PMZ80_005274 [Knufia obscura]KAK5957941.1 hypothetical protein OHC33_001131 [Knufia fluminis]